MTKFIEKPTAITPNRELQSDEYFNETDHLIYCSKCNTPRQCRHELQGKP
jgi:DNA replication protein DnaC